MVHTNASGITQCKIQALVCSVVNLNYFLSTEMKAKLFAEAARLIRHK